MIGRIRRVDYGQDYLQTPISVISTSCSRSGLLEVWWNGDTLERRLSRVRQSRDSGEIDRRNGYRRALDNSPVEQKRRAGARKVTECQYKPSHECELEG